MPEAQIGLAYVTFMSLVGRAYEEFVSDFDRSTKIPEATRLLIKQGLGDIIKLAYPVNPQNSPRQLQDAEVALLQVAA